MGEMTGIGPATARMLRSKTLSIKRASTGYFEVWVESEADSMECIGACSGSDPNEALAIAERYAIELEGGSAIAPDLGPLARGLIDEGWHIHAFPPSEHLDRWQFILSSPNRVGVCVTQPNQVGMDEATQLLEQFIRDNDLGRGLSYEDEALRTMSRSVEQLHRDRGY